MGDILHFTYLYFYIYTLFVINKPSGSLAMEVSINQNITGLLGNNDTPLTCSFIKKKGEKISSVQIMISNKTDDIRPIAIFIPNNSAKLLPLGYYLNDRVTLTNITDASTNATLTFHQLKCEDEQEYICKCFFKHGGDIDSLKKSPLTRISVQATSSKPDLITSTIVSSSKKESQEHIFPINNTFLSTKQNDILTFRTLPVETVTTAHLQFTDKRSFVFREEDTVILTCTGNVGNPPGKLIWQKTFPQGKKPISYSNETTYIEEIYGQCSFKGTSHLTVKIYAEDIKAIIRCFEESQVDVPGMYLETAPFDVQFEVNHVDISKQPNQKHYDPKTDKIILTCKGNGNPEPTYEWFKKDKNNSILSNKNVYVIENVVRNSSGVYICEIYNIINDVRYRKSNSVEIDIEDDLQSSPESAPSTFFEEYKTYFICGAAGVGFVVLCAVIARIWCCCFRRKGKENKVSCSPKSRSDDIIMSAEYATVIHTESSTEKETGDTLVVFNRMDGNKNNSRNKQEDQNLRQNVNVNPNMQTTSDHSHIYADPSDALQAGNVTGKIVPSFTSFKDPKE